LNDCVWREFVTLAYQRFSGLKFCDFAPLTA
jgi:hypothetical protein